VVPDHEDDLAYHLGVFIDDAVPHRPAGGQQLEDMRQRCSAGETGSGVKRLTFFIAESLPAPLSPCREHR
jgi:hypothetical protein